MIVPRKTTMLTNDMIRPALTLAKTRKIAALVGLAFVALIPLTGCGSAPSVDQERTAAIASTKAWVDADDCNVLSDEYAKQWGDTTEEGRKECGKETYPA